MKIKELDDEEYEFAVSAVIYATYTCSILSTLKESHNIYSAIYHLNNYNNDIHSFGILYVLCMFVLLQSCFFNSNIILCNIHVLYAKKFYYLFLHDC